MKTIILFTYLGFILFSVVMAFIYRHAIRKRGMSIMLPYLLLVFIQEAGLSVYLWEYPQASTSFVYNFYRPVSVIVFFWIYYNLPFMRSVRKPLLWLTILYLGITLSSYVFLGTVKILSDYLVLSRSLVITFFGILFLFNYFHLDNIKEEKYWRPLLWITVGIVIYYPVISISSSFQRYLAANDATLYGFKIYQTIPQVMSIFMYSCFSYAFYLCQKKN